MKKLAILILVAAMSLFAISNAFAVSQAAVLFLMISPGARAAGMGQTFCAVADDATAIYWNPAGLAFQRGGEVTTMFARWLPQLVGDMYYLFFAYKQHVPAIYGTVGVNVIFLNLGEQYLTGEAGPEVLDTFYSWDAAISVAYAAQISKHLGLGVNMKYIHSNLSPVGAGEEKGSGVGRAFAVDLGVLYKFWFWDRLAIGMNLSNLGPKITYVDAAQADPLPTNLKLGLACRILDSEYNKLTVAFDTNRMLVVRHEDGTSDPFYKAIFSAWGDGSFGQQMSQMISSVGAEYNYNNLLYLRAGYYYDYEGKVQYPTFGAGLGIWIFRLDFAYDAAPQGHPLSDTMRFSLTVGF